jgi:hypothetical protein
LDSSSRGKGGTPGGFSMSKIFAFFRRCEGPAIFDKCIEANDLAFFSLFEDGKRVN